MRWLAALVVLLLHHSTMHRFRRRRRSSRADTRRRRAPRRWDLDRRLRPLPSPSRLIHFRFHLRRLRNAFLVRRRPPSLLRGRQFRPLQLCSTSVSTCWHHRTMLTTFSLPYQRMIVGRSIRLATSTACGMCSTRVCGPQTDRRMGRSRRGRSRRSRHSSCSMPSTTTSTRNHTWRQSVPVSRGRTRATARVPRAIPRQASLFAPLRPERSSLLRCSSLKQSCLPLAPSPQLPRVLLLHDRRLLSAFVARLFPRLL